MNRSIRRLYLTLAAGFGLLMLMLGYWQVVAADGLQDRPGNEPDRPGRAAGRPGPDRLGRRQGAGGEPGRAREGPEGVRAPLPAGRPRRPDHRLHAPRRAKTGLEEHLRPLPVGQLRHRAAAAAPEPEREGGRERRASASTRASRRSPQERSRAGAGAVVALDPRTGQVIAMASSPTFDLQLAVDDFDGDPRRGRRRCSTARCRASTRPARPSRS